MGTKAKFAFPPSQGNWSGGHKDNKQGFSQGTLGHMHLSYGRKRGTNDFTESSEDRPHSLPLLSILLTVFYHLYCVNGTLSGFKYFGSNGQVRIREK